jgi:hypothetical protein
MNCWCCIHCSRKYDQWEQGERTELTANLNMEEEKRAVRLEDTTPETRRFYRFKARSCFLSLEKRYPFLVVHRDHADWEKTIDVITRSLFDHRDDENKHSDEISASNTRLIEINLSLHVNRGPTSVQRREWPGFRYENTAIPGYQVGDTLRLLVSHMDMHDLKPNSIVLYAGLPDPNNNASRDDLVRIAVYQSYRIYNFADRTFSDPLPEQTRLDSPLTDVYNTQFDASSGQRHRVIGQFVVFQWETQPLSRDHFMKLGRLGLFEVTEEHRYTSDLPLVSYFKPLELENPRDRVSPGSVFVLIFRTKFPGKKLVISPLGCWYTQNLDQDDIKLQHDKYRDFLYLMVTVAPDWYARRQSKRRMLQSFSKMTVVGPYIESKPFGHPGFIYLDVEADSFRRFYDSGWIKKFWPKVRYPTEKMVQDTVDAYNNREPMAVDPLEDEDTDTEEDLDISVPDYFQQERDLEISKKYLEMVMCKKHKLQVDFELFLKDHLHKFYRFGSNSGVRMHFDYDPMFTTVTRNGDKLTVRTRVSLLRGLGPHLRTRDHLKYYQEFWTRENIAPA